MDTMLLLTEIGFLALQIKKEKKTVQNNLPK